MEINIEPGFFEWLAWYPDSLPNWLTTSELKEAKYKINQNYKPLVTANNLKDSLKETAEEFYTRNSNVLNEIIKTTTGNVLIVAHAATLDTCTRQLVGEPPRSSYELGKIIHKIPYCSLVNIEESVLSTEDKAGDSICNWTLIEPICPSVTHNKNIRFDWNVLLTK
ncbi:UBASH3B.2 family protein [Megaselia abdita]